MRPDIESELQAAMLATPFSAVQHALALGADRGLIGQLAARFDVAVAAGTLLQGGTRWEPDGPDRRLLIGVRDECGALIDYVAVSSARRDEWALRTGHGWALGIAALDEIRRQLFSGDVRRARLRLYATPIAWLAGSGDGLCVLDWRAGALNELRSLGEACTILTDDRAAADRLRQMLQHGGLPRVESKESLLAASANVGFASMPGGGSAKPAGMERRPGANISAGVPLRRRRTA